MGSIDILYKHSMVHPIVADAYIEEKENLPKQILINEVPDTSVQAHMDFNPEPPTPTKYTITTGVDPEGSGTVTGGGEYDENETATLTATASGGYAFVKWNDGETNSTREITVTGDATYTAIFEAVTPPPPTKYTITTGVDPEGSGTVTGGGEYDENETATLTATASEGYAFVKWNDDETNSTREITVTGDATYTAIFEAVTPPPPTKTYNITVLSNNSSMGSVEGGGEVEEGGSVTIRAIAREDHCFTQWSDGNTETIRTIENVTEDMTFTAYFEEINYFTTSNFSFHIVSELDTPPSLQYKFGDDQDSWHDLEFTKNGSEWVSSTIDSFGYNVLWRGNNELLSIADVAHPTNEKFTYFVIENYYEGQATISGNIQTLARYDGQLDTAICMKHLFYDCWKLSTAADLQLPATILTPACYDSMFYGCHLLSSFPKLPATTLAPWCYSGMFYGCASAHSAPALPATELSNGCYNQMYKGCNFLMTNDGGQSFAFEFGAEFPVTIGSTQYNKPYELANYMGNVAGFPGITTYTVGGVISQDFPKGWVSENQTIQAGGSAVLRVTVVDGYEVAGTSAYGDVQVELLKLNNNTYLLYNINSNVALNIQIYPKGVSFNKDGDSEQASNIKMISELDEAPYMEWCSADNPDWTKWNFTGSAGNWESEELIVKDSYHGGSGVFVRGNNGYLSIADVAHPDNEKFSYFTSTSDNPDIYVYGDIRYLTDYNNLTDTAKCMKHLFYGFTNLISAGALELPATTLTEACYDSMFYNCINLAYPPQNLPAPVASEYAYSGMYMNCSSLRSASNIGATSYGNMCFNSMYANDTFNMSDDGTTFNFGFAGDFPITVGSMTFNTPRDLAAHMGNTNGFNRSVNLSNYNPEEELPSTGDTEEDSVDPTPEK